MRERNVQLKEVVLELDFLVKNGVAPALKEPPEFTISVTSDYLHADLPMPPSWLGDGHPNALKFLQERYEQVSNSKCEQWANKELLTMVRFTNRNTQLHSMQMSFDAEAEMPMFSKDTVDVFSRAMRGDDSRLEEVFPPAMVQIIKTTYYSLTNTRHVIPEQNEDGSDCSGKGFAATAHLANNSFDFEQWFEGLDEIELEQFLAEVDEDDTDGLDNDDS